MSPESRISSAREAVIVAAAGRGERFKGELPKALETVSGRSLLAHCLESLTNLEFEPFVVITSPEAHVADVARICAEFPNLETKVVAGGVLRSDSVVRALSHLPPSVEFVYVHDAARAFTPSEVFGRVRSALDAGHVAVVPVLPTRDTVDEIDPDGAVVRTFDRSNIRLVQTPQGFSRTKLVAAYQTVGCAGVTDDASAMELSGHIVQTVEGDLRAFKVTDPFDRYVAAAVVAQQGESTKESE